MLNDDSEEYMAKRSKLKTANKEETIPAFYRVMPQQEK